MRSKFHFGLAAESLLADISYATRSARVNYEQPPRHVVSVARASDWRTGAARRKRVCLSGDAVCRVSFVGILLSALFEKVSTICRLVVRCTP